MSPRLVRLGLLIAVAGAVPGLPRSGAAQTVAIGVTGNATALVSDYVHVPLFADLTGAPGVKLGSYTVRVAWNSRVLSYFGFDSPHDEGAFATPQVNTDSSSDGVLYVTAASALGQGGVFDLTKLTFFVDSLGSTAITVQVLEASAAGTLTDLLPSVAAVSGGFCPGTGRWGDVDGDGYANSRDALVMLSSIVGLSVNPAQFDLSVGDVDGDGKTNSRDALIVLSYGVGLSITGQRVLLVAAVGCALGTTPSLRILPDTIDVVPNQITTLQVIGVGADGRPVGISSVNWQVTDGRVASVTSGGDLLGIDAGTTTIVASLGPGVTTQAPIVVRSHRPVWHVDPHAATATVQLGSARWPMSTPQNVFPFVSEGDTIRVHPGTVDWDPDKSSSIPVGIVLIGDTLADGTRPLLRGHLGEFTEGLEWDGGKKGVVANLEFRNFGEPIDIFGLFNLTMSNVIISSPDNGGTGLFADEPMDTLRVSHSRFLDVELIADDAHIVLLDHNFIRNGNDLPLDIEPSGVPGSVLRSVGDSVLPAVSLESPEWAFVSMDSVFLDSMVVLAPADRALNAEGEFDNVTSLEVRHSQFLNIADFALRFGGRHLVVDSSTFTGCQVSVECDWTRGRGIIFDSGFGPDGPTVTSVNVSHSSFFGLGIALNMVSAFDHGSVAFTHNVVDSVGYPVFVLLDTATVTDNVFTRLREGALDYEVRFNLPPGALLASRNQITCTPGLAGLVAIEVTHANVVIEDNAIRGCTSGIDASGDATLFARIARDTILPADTSSATFGVSVEGDLQTNIFSNRIIGGGYGIELFTGLDTTFVDTNVVSGTGQAGILIQNNGPTLLRANNVTNNFVDGVQVFCVGPAPLIHDGRIVGNLNYGIHTPECSDSVDASHNWWGNAAGAGGGVADSVNSARIATDNPLTSDPAGGTVPLLSPKAWSFALSKAPVRINPVKRPSAPPARPSHVARPVPDATSAPRGRHPWGHRVPPRARRRS